MEGVGPRCKRSGTNVDGAKHPMLRRKWQILHSQSCALVAKSPDVHSQVQMVLSPNTQVQKATSRNRDGPYFSVTLLSQKMPCRKPTTSGPCRSRQRATQLDRSVQSSEAVERDLSARNPALKPRNRISLIQTIRSKNLVGQTIEPKEATPKDCNQAQTGTSQAGRFRKMKPQTQVEQSCEGTKKGRRGHSQAQT